MNAPLVATSVLFGAWLVQLFVADWVLHKVASTRAALAWLLALVLLPGLGLVAWLAFGRRRLPRRLRAKVAHQAPFHAAAARLPCPSSARPPSPMARVALALGQPPPRPGNRVSALETGEEAFAAIVTALRAATQHIHVEEYIFRDEGLGERVLEVLEERARAGVEVRVLVDPVGSTAARRILRRVRAAGGQGALFLPLFPFGLTLTVNWRTHRKIILCDGRVGFVGGMNVGDEYFGRPWRHRFWSDAHLRLEGPAVHDLQLIFAQDWDFATGERLLGPRHLPPLAPLAAPAGAPPTEVAVSDVQIVASGPDQPVNATRQVLLTALAVARTHLCLVTPYLVLDTTTRELLEAAARRGVRVQVVTQGDEPEILATWLSSRFSWEALLEAGVEVYAYDRGVLHTKLYTVDRSWAAVGSPNFDPRSFGVNFEVMALLDGPEAVAQILERQEVDLRRSRRVELARFRQRSAMARRQEALARLLSPLL